MSGLRSVIEEIIANDLASMSGDELAADVVEVSRAVDVLTCRIAAITDEVRRRGIHETQGFLSVTRWLAHISDADDSTAQRIVTMGPDASRAPRDPPHRRER